MARYLPHTEEEVKEMLEAIGVKNVEELYRDIPEELRSEGLNLPNGLDEISLKRHFNDLSRRNRTLKEYMVFRGAGVYYHHVPEVVKHLAMRSEFLTAYTPYQAEVSQGTLQVMFEFQTMICELTGMDVANSSMYDGASATAEAILMASRLTDRFRALVASNIHPEYLQVSRTYAEGAGIKIEMVKYDEDTGRVDLDDLKKMLTSNEKPSCFVTGYPNFFGVIEDLRLIREALPDDVMMIVVVNPLTLALLEPPGSFGADIVVGDGQPLGIPPRLGGPSFGIFATKEKHVRQMPGRIVGMTEDREGRTGFVMILQTREQHIRRHRATSNICSNHAHGALMATIYLSYMGKHGLQEVAKQCYSKAHYLADKLSKVEGIRLRFSGPFFNEFVASVDVDPFKLNEYLKSQRILGPLPLKRFYSELHNEVLFCATEMNTAEEITFLAGRLEAMKNADI
ncbi:MAG: glycine dehydrogenase subunit 1 [Thermotogota bacterium]|nr:glycine dehydrogenase subunit 1 [Thermotogota bacterium]MDK2864737.1 glycine dehydrogenase subunit 1 [Thermotogota bacterium]